MIGTLITFGVVIWLFSMIALAAHGRVNSLNEKCEALQKKIITVENSITKLCEVLVTMNQANQATSNIIKGFPDLIKQHFAEQIEQAIKEKMN